MEIECEEILLDSPIEGFNPLEPATSGEEYEEDCEDLEGYINIMRCIIITSVDSKAWKRTSIFYTYAQYRIKVCKLVIDRGISMSVVSKSVINRLKLKSQPHPYRVAWVDKTSLPINKYYLVPIQLGCYSNEIM